MSQLRWGILASGNIAHAFAKGLAGSSTGTLVASASRSLENATKFAETHGGKAYGSYAELLADPEVDAVYIASPHHLHMEHTIAVAEAGKHILCEKPFTLNALEAERALAAVDAAGVFFMEAFMYRTSSHTQKLKELVHSGIIGQVLQINVEFGFQAGKDWDNFRADAALGGGGLMDVGTYCVSFSRMITGEEPVRCHFEMLAPNGYDESAAGLMKFPSGAVAHFGTGVHVNLNNQAVIYGEKGKITVESPWFCKGKITIAVQGSEPEVFDYSGDETNLYTYECDAVAKFLEAKESPYMSKADTLGNMRTLDALRKSAGLDFAAELKA